MRRNGRDAARAVFRGNAIELPVHPKAAVRSTPEIGGTVTPSGSSERMAITEEQPHALQELAIPRRPALPRWRGTA